MDLAVARALLVLLLIHLPQGVFSQDCTQRADICFVVDSSGSIRGSNPNDGSYDNWGLLLAFINQVVDRFNIGSDQTRVGMVQFADNAQLVFSLNRYLDKDGLRNFIRTTPYTGGWTNTGAGLDVMRTQCFNSNGDRDDVVDIAIVITDGKSTENPERTKPAAQDAKNAGIQIFAVGITGSVDQQELRDISSGRQQENVNWFRSTDFTTLNSVLSNLVRETCAITPAPVPRPTGPTDCPVAADIAFIMDSSRSITWTDEGNWVLMKNFIFNVIDAFPIARDRTRVGLVKFSDSANVEFFLDKHFSSQAVRLAIDAIRQTGAQTNIADGLRLMRDYVFTVSRGDRDTAPNIAILLTDGKANVFQDLTISEATLAKERGIEIFAIGITDEIDITEIRAIASDPDSDRVFTVRNFDRLGDILEDVIERACQVVPTGPAPPPSTTTRPAPTTTPLPPIPDGGCDNGRADVIFCLDVSGSIGDQNFDLVRRFVSDVVKQVDVEGGQIRVGALTYSDGADIEFHLNRYPSRLQISDAVLNIRYRRGRTNTAAALRTVRSQMFTSGNGARTDATKILVVVTDGESSNGEETLREARLTKDSGVHVISVGIGDWLDRYELEALASYPASINMIHVSGFSALSSIVTKIRDAVCQNGSPCRSNPCVNGRCVEGILFYWCQCYQGWGGPNCDSRCPNAADVVIAMDASGSVGAENFKRTIEFVTRLVGRLDIDNGQGNMVGVRVGLLTFASNTILKFQLNMYNTRVQVLDAVNVRYTGGTTNTASALRYIRENMFRPENGDRPAIPNLVLVITDGKSDDRNATWREAMQARQSGIHITAIGIGGGVSQEELRGMVSAPTDPNVIRVDSFNALDTVVSQVAEGLCDIKNECESNPCRNGAACTDVPWGYSCSPCPPGYTGYHCERGCSGVVDVVFMLDSSGSIRSERFPLVKDFVASIIQELDVFQGRTRVGVGYWSDASFTNFHLRDYASRHDVIQALQRTPFLGGRTNTPAALRLLWQQMFSVANGDRDGVPNYAIIITDGNSNIDPSNTIPEAIQARINGIYIMVVSVGKHINKLELEGIASEPKDRNIYSVESIRDLQQIHDQIKISFCDDFNECQSNPCRNGARCFDDLKRYICFCSSGFTGYNCERRCSRQLDLTLVLDLSSSVEEEFRMTLDLAKRIVYGVDMQFDRTRIGLVAYSTDVINTFYLNDYTEKESVINALNFYIRGGKTNTQEALRVMHSDIFTSSRGDRPGVRNVAILVSDGDSNVNEFNTVPEANMAKDLGIQMYAVALGQSPKLSEMNAISSNPDSEYTYWMRNSAEVDQVADQMLDRLCQ